MRSKLITAVLVISTVVRPSAAVAEPTYKVNTDAQNDIKVVEVIKTTLENDSILTKDEIAEKQIQEYIKRLEAEKLAAEAKAKAEAVVAATPKRVVNTSNVQIPDTNACVIAMKQVFPQNLWKIGYAIMKAESGARPNAIGGPNYNGTYDYGCWQINNTPRALDPLAGAKIALYKYNHSGWYPWTVYKTGAYLRYF
jgi:hypothetical protein